VHSDSSFSGRKSNRPGGSTIEKEGKQFFFEKKNQKTVVCFGQQLFSPVNSALDAMGKSFLLLFFKKEVLP
jgi:hypothetical protein